MNTRLEGGTAGDLITCRPFDASLALFEAGHLASLNDLEGMDNFGSVAKSAWITDDGSDVFCVPMASVIHGFIYNQDIFDDIYQKAREALGFVKKKEEEGEGGMRKAEPGMRKAEWGMRKMNCGGLGV